MNKFRVFRDCTNIDFSKVFITNTNRYTKKGDEVKGVNKLLKVISYRPINETVNLDIEIRENNFEEKN